MLVGSAAPTGIPAGKYVYCINYVRDMVALGG
jgi:hypothetical protein